MIFVGKSQYLWNNIKCWPGCDQVVSLEVRMKFPEFTMRLAIWKWSCEVGSLVFRNWFVRCWIAVKWTGSFADHSAANDPQPQLIPSGGIWSPTLLTLSAHFQMFFVTSSLFLSRRACASLKAAGFHDLALQGTDWEKPGCLRHFVQRCICVVKLTVSNNRKCPGKRRTYPTSYTGSLFSASHGRWKTLVAAGHVTTQNLGAKIICWAGRCRRTEGCGGGGSGGGGGGECGGDCGGVDGGDGDGGNSWTDSCKSSLMPCLVASSASSLFFLLFSFLFSSSLFFEQRTSLGCCLAIF